MRDTTGFTATLRIRSKKAFNAVPTNLSRLQMLSVAVICTVLCCIALFYSSHGDIVLFHYVAPEEMRTLEFLVYHAPPFTRHEIWEP